MADRLVIANGIVVTMNDAREVHHGGTVVVEGDRVVAVHPRGPEADAARDGASRVIDATDKAVLPGLVDLHYHTALGKGYSDHLPLLEYLETCWYPIIRALDHEAAYWAALASYSESLRCGVTTVNDMYRRLDALAPAAERIGIRAVLSNDVATDEHRLDTLAGPITVESGPMVTGTSRRVASPWRRDRVESEMLTARWIELSSRARRRISRRRMASAISGKP